MSAAEEPHFGFETLAVSQVGGSPHVLDLRLNRPDKRNAMTTKLWAELDDFFRYAADDPACRCVLLTAAGRTFCAGIDLQGGTALSGPSGSKQKLDPARVAINSSRNRSRWQRAFASIAECGKPVIACVHGGCLGAGLELVSYADIRFCTADAFFSAPEVDLAIAGENGGLQQLPKLVGNDSLLRELMLSGRRMAAQEAKEFGFISRVCADQEDMMRQASELALTIAAKSPVATYGIKTLLNYTRDHSVEDSRRFALTWNASAIQTVDTAIAGRALVKKEPAVFDNLRGGRGGSKL